LSELSEICLDIRLGLMGVQVGAERLFPAWEKFVPCPGNFCALPSAQKFDGRLEEFLPTAGRISSDGSTNRAESCQKSNLRDTGVNPVSFL